METNPKDNLRRRLVECVQIVTCQIMLRAVTGLRAMKAWREENSSRQNT